LSIIITILIGLLTVLFAVKKKVALTVVGSLVFAISLFIASPELLSPTLIVATTEMVNWLVAAIGAIIALVAIVMKEKKASLLVLVLVGVTVMLWGVFRNIPALPPAFEALSIQLQAAGELIWTAIKQFWGSATR
jgi:hypothetical protein